MIDVIIPARNEAETIAPIVRAFQSVNEVGLIIVAVDSTTDDTIPILKDMNVAYIEGEWNGKGQAVKAALEHIESMRTVLCDADLTGFTFEHASILARF